MAIRELLVEFTSKFNPEGLHEGHHETAKLLEEVKELGEAILAAFAVEKIYEFIEGVVGTTAALKLQADRLGLSTDKLQEWTYAGQQVGLQGEELDGVFRKLSQAVVSGDEATGKAAANFQELGLEVKDANGQFKDSGTLFEEIGLKLGAMQDQTKATAIAVKLFGRGAATRILQLFKEGAPGLDKLREKFGELGGAIDANFIEQADEARKSMINLSHAWLIARTQIVALLLPALEYLVEKWEHVALGMQKLVRETNIVKGALAALGLLGAATAVKLLAKYAPLILRFGLWAIAIAAAALAVDDLITFFEGGKSAVGEFLDAAFGPGSQDMARNWAEGAKDAITTFVSDAAFALGDFWTSIVNAADLTVGYVARAFFRLGLDIQDALAGAARSAAKVASFVGADGAAASLNSSADEMSADSARARLMDDPLQQAEARATARTASQDEGAKRLKERSIAYGERDRERRGKRDEIAALHAHDDVSGAQSLPDAVSTPAAENVSRAPYAPEFATAPISAAAPQQTINYSTQVTAPINMSIAPGTSEAQVRAVQRAAKSGAESGWRGAVSAFEQRGRP